MCLGSAPRATSGNAKILARVHVWKQREILEYHRQIPVGGRKLRNVAATNANFAGVGRLQSQQ